MPGGGDAALALGSQGGDDQGRGAPQVRGRRFRAMEPFHAADPGQTARKLNVRSEGPQAGDVAEAVGKDRLLDHGAPRGPEQGRHDRSLGVGWKGRIGPRDDGPRRPKGPAAQPELALRLGNLTARPGQDPQDRAELGGPELRQRQLAPRRRGGAEPGGGLHPIRQDPIGSAVEGSRRHPDAGAPRAPKLRPAGPQKRGQVPNLGLLRRPQDADRTLGSQGGQDQIFRGPHAGIGQQDRPAGRSAPAEQAISLAADPDAQGLQAPQMQVQGPFPQDAAPGQRDLRLAPAGQQGPQQQDRGAEAAREGRVRGGSHGTAAVNVQDAFPFLGIEAQALQKGPGHGQVPDGRTVGEGEAPRKGRRRRQDRQHGVLAPLDRQPPPQRPSAPDRKRFQ